MKVSFSLHKQF